MRFGIVLLLASGCAFGGDSLDFEIEPGGASRCDVGEDQVVCDRVSLSFATGTLRLSGRRVHMMHPVGEAPAQGWPVAFLFSGALHSAGGFFEGSAGDEFGGLHQTRLVAALLDAGYAVVAPETRYGGSTYWDTNVAPYNVLWDTSEDHQLMVEILRAIDDGVLGPLDPSRLFATGISSGGYMTSRMAVSYRGRFRALAIQSASYATCSGALCDIPGLPEDHPPTLFLHGGADLVVPTASARAYADALADQGTRSEVIVDDGIGHAWLEVAPESIVEWFDQRR